jgi:hypothetical protein
MSGDIAAAADIITGALAARSVEPEAGDHQAGGGHGGALCLNCGTRLIGAHCHACGQSGHVHRTVGAIGHEIAHGVFHFEGKIWRTLPMLILHPGDLTRRYVAGERARFVSPLALFLFTVFLLFATISAVGGDFAEAVSPEPMSKNHLEFARAAEKAREKLGEARRRRAALVVAGKPTAEVDNDIKALGITANVLGARQKDTDAAGDDADHFTFSNVKTGWPRLDHGIDKANANPGLAIYKLQSSAYKYSWLLIPISTPFVALLFLWRRRFGLYDHAVFVTYSLAFMMLMVMALTLGGAAGLPAGWITLTVFVLPPIHMFAQLRGAYSLGKLSALWRMTLLLFFAWFALATFITLLLLHGLAD